MALSYGHPGRRWWNIFLFVVCLLVGCLVAWLLGLLGLFGLFCLFVCLFVWCWNRWQLKWKHRCIHTGRDIIWMYFFVNAYCSTHILYIHKFCTALLNWRSQSWRFGVDYRFESNQPLLKMGMFNHCPLSLHICIHQVHSTEPPSFWVDSHFGMVLLWIHLPDFSWLTFAPLSLVEAGSTYLTLHDVDPETAERISHFQAFADEPCLDSNLLLQSWVMFFS